VETKELLLLTLRVQRTNEAEARIAVVEVSRVLTIVLEPRKCIRFRAK